LNRDQIKIMIGEIFLVLISAYLLAGFLFALAFMIKGVDKIDEGAIGSSVGFRIIIFPGTMVLWPLLLKKWLKSSKTVHHD